jgi:hypothetical protein
MKEIVVVSVVSEEDNNEVSVETKPLELQREL